MGIPKDAFDDRVAGRRRELKLFGHASLSDEQVAQLLREEAAFQLDWALGRLAAMPVNGPRAIEERLRELLEKTPR